MPSADFLEYKSLVVWPFVVGPNYGVLQKRKVPISEFLSASLGIAKTIRAGVKYYEEYKIAKAYSLCKQCRLLVLIDFCPV